ncbi:MAG TPA: GTP-binding protein [Hypericibacter adhaerens]|uniref:CobW family GTP-binding protein n=1 Tax=Hypericibacter adhaerens TaxID=2602016 RepID=UPI002C299DED|nr:GTP-binding protein [Hypericibacter adhaerens]HWA42392.1 GTP-binding protein [Hypericibacter adhaerens]
MSREDILPEERLPASLLTGFLGSGKTTLLSRLLRQPALAETAVIINEFGEIGLDHLLVENAPEQPVLLDSGCLCCTIRGDLIDTLRSLFRRRVKGGVPPFKRVVIESTGLADPAPILQTLMSDPLLADRFRLDGVIATVDAVNGMSQLDRHFESVKQAAVADRLVLTQTDLAEPATLAALQARLKALNPAAPQILARQGEVDGSRLFDAGLFNPALKTPDVQGWLRAEAYEAPRHDHDHGHDHGHEHGHTHEHGAQSASDRNRHDAHIRAFCLTAERPLDWERFTRFIETLIARDGDKLLRIKGVLNVAGFDTPVAVHGVQHLFHPPALLPAWPDAERRSRLVLIVKDLREEEIRQEFSPVTAN